MVSVWHTNLNELENSDHSCLHVIHYPVLGAQHSQSSRNKRPKKATGPAWPPFSARSPQFPLHLNWPLEVLEPRCECLPSESWCVGLIKKRLPCEWLITHLPDWKYGQHPRLGSSHSKSLIFLRAPSEVSLRIGVYRQQVPQSVHNVKLVEPP